MSTRDAGRDSMDDVGMLGASVAPQPSASPGEAPAVEAPPLADPSAPAQLQPGEESTAPQPDSDAPIGTHGPPPDAPPIGPPRFLEPRRIAVRDRRPTGRSPQRFTSRPPLVRPALRVAPGFSGRIGSRPPAAFGLDVLGSVMVGLHGGYRQWGLAPEVGYSLRAPGVDHRLLLGLGLIDGINAESWSLGWLPRVVLTGEEVGPWGLRNGLWFDFAENGFSVELSHQWLRQSDASVHELQVTLGIDLAMLVIVLADWRVSWL